MKSTEFFIKLNLIFKVIPGEDLEISQELEPHILIAHKIRNKILHSINLFHQYAKAQFFDLFVNGNFFNDKFQGLFPGDTTYSVIMSNATDGLTAAESEELKNILYPEKSCVTDGTQSAKSEILFSIVDEVINDFDIVSHNLIFCPGEMKLNESAEIPGLSKPLDLFDSVLLSILFAKKSDLPDLSITNLAKLHRITPKKLDSLFRENQKEPLASFLNRFRVVKAFNIISENPALSIDELACVTGFSDINVLETEFKKCFGLSLEDFIKLNNL